MSQTPTPFSEPPDPEGYGSPDVAARYAAGLPHASPPTLPGPLGPPRPPGWPVPISVVMIVLGLLAVMGGVFGVLGALLTDLIAAYVPGAHASMAGAVEYKDYQVFSAVMSGLAGGLLAFAGFRINHRRRSGVRLSRLWAVFKMVVVVYAAVLAYFIQDTQFAAMAAQQGPGAAVVTVFMRAFTAAGVLLTIAWGWALPIFLFVWFSRPKVKAYVEMWKP